MGQLVGEHAADDVGGPAGRERHDQADGAIGVFRVGARNSGGRERAEAARKQLATFHGMPSCMSVTACLNA
jgi:hypothetical protein